ncbi:MAG: diaminopimelate epimerase, partial [Deltaproteobacteria bacterium]|nr:diaminopimelate epimerase [Deltaproteobacteria bacterium]
MAKVTFSKMHGTGNDFLVLDGVNHDLPSELPVLAQKLSHRRFGVGFDQMLIIRPSETADFKMEILNADGSQVEMCGNGIRCVAKYITDHELSDKKELTIETLGGLIRPKLIGDLVEVDMG